MIPNVRGDDYYYCRFHSCRIDWTTMDWQTSESTETDLPPSYSGPRGPPSDATSAQPTDRVGGSGRGPHPTFDLHWSWTRTRIVELPSVTGFPFFPEPTTTTYTTSVPVDPVPVTQSDGAGSNAANKPSKVVPPGPERSDSTKPPSQGDDTDNHSGLGKGQVVAAVVLPLVVTALLVLIIFVVLRRRKQKSQPHPPQDEMKMRTEPTSSTTGLHQPVGPQVPPPVFSPSSPQPPPVIISAMAPSGNAAYFTGIDTSEALSVRSGQQGQQMGGFMMDGEHHEEPPPPYRPASVPPLSRDSSMRSRLSRQLSDNVNTRLAAHHSQNGVNPFADPSEDDHGSFMSGYTNGPFGRRHDDQLSIVSDLSYQDEQPTMVHQTV
ncbi:uncharacterized protein K452DRAFT_95022 [Aplosporella prunicola CBS 121167]|uniref:Uncharacterized protein n=1 Tax=Aplosporella prunicola CBS 121167 TaxID=1176127 RepID=A0A6A6B3B7_9PEZI|nr:uncharacterized protein K452DRAFT_95022 [Aplosporella prunicola CBS 121167]KAF2138098.1 hypothetical protein K452DRAFT_95022 [Aplosporella prunicola CBS 121167]